MLEGFGTANRSHERGAGIEIPAKVSAILQSTTSRSPHGELRLKYHDIGVDLIHAISLPAQGVGIEIPETSMRRWSGSIALRMGSVDRK